MSFTERDEAIAFWLAQVGHAIARRYGCRYFPDLEISEAGVIARCCNSQVASTIWQLRQGLIDLGCARLQSRWHCEIWRAQSAT